MVSLRTYIVVYIALMILLGLTIGVSFIEMGFWGVIVAVTIAVVKAVLIVLYFMHVRYSSRLIWVFAGGGFVWLIIMIGLTMNDYVTRGLLSGS